jgi:internalin A
VLKSTLLQFFCVFALLTGLAIPAAGQTVVDFPDPNLEAEIRDAIGKPTGPIYDTDVAGLTSLDADGVAISDLTGLEYCTDLTYLSLDNNQISDLSALAGCTSLTYLNLSTNQISDLSALA